MWDACLGPAHPPQRLVELQADVNSSLLQVSTASPGEADFCLRTSPLSPRGKVKTLVHLLLWAESRGKVRFIRVSKCLPALAWYGPRHEGSLASRFTHFVLTHFASFDKEAAGFPLPQIQISDSRGNDWGLAAPPLAVAG